MNYCSEHHSCHRPVANTDSYFVHSRDLAIV